MKKYFLFFLFFLSVVNAEVSRRDTPISVKTSLIIPVHVKHVKLLPNLIREYIYEQTVKVDEIVISISNISEVRAKYPKVLRELERTNWPIPVILVKNDHRTSEGDNRNRACQYANGDVFICQDADDIPHKQRVEVIKYFFENYHVDHLVHKYCMDNDTSFMNRRIPDMESVRWFSPSVYAIDNGANGVSSLTRRVFESIQWNPEFVHAVDVQFNRTVYDRFENRVVVDEPIYFYRINYTGN